MPEPKHPSQSGRPAAERQFVGREESIAPVHAALKEPPRTKPLVLVYYGGAGIGKSRLRLELTKQMAAEPGVLTATLDFATPIHRQPESALFFLRNTIHEAYKVRFPSFDLAYAYLWQKSHPDAPLASGDMTGIAAIPDRVPKEASEPDSLLSQLLDNSGKLPLTGLVPRISKLVAASLDPSTARPLDHFLSDWWLQRGERELEDLPQMEPGKIVECLPKLWAADLKDALRATSHKPQAASEEPAKNRESGSHHQDTKAQRGSGRMDTQGRRAVLFIDAYEQLWEAGSSEADFLKRDEWVRELVKQLPEALWVICGRQKLGWEEKEPDWSDSLSQHELNALPDQASRQFLASCGIASEPIQDAIVKGSQGVPHYLDLAVDTLERTKDEGQRTKLTGDSPDELVQQFVRHLDRPELEALQVLSAPRYWYYGLFENLMSEYETGYPATAYDDLGRFSFISDGAAPETRTMHELMREALQETQSPELRKRVHLFLHEYYAKQLEGLEVKGIAEKHKAALTEAFYHGRQTKSEEEFWPWFEAAACVFNEAHQDRLLTPLYREMVEALESELGPNHADLATALWRRATVVANLGEYDEAEPLHRRAVAVSEEALGPRHYTLARSLNALGVLLVKQNRCAEAEPLLARALTIRENVLGPDHPDVAHSLENLAVLRVSQGRHAEAELLARRALGASEQSLGADQLGTADALAALAFALFQQAKHAQAEPLARRALAIREKLLGPEHPKVAESLDILASQLVSDAKSAEAEALTRRALAIFEQTLGPEHTNVAYCVGRLALLMNMKGRDTEAEELLRREAAIWQQTLGPEHPNVASALGNLAILLGSEGRFAEAEAMARRSLAISERKCGSDHLDVAFGLNTLAEQLQRQGRCAEAEPLARRALAIREKSLGSESSTAAYSLATLADVLNVEGRHAEAESLARRSLAILEKALGSGHPYVAESLHTLIATLVRQCKYAEAEPLARRALAIREAKSGPDHPDVAKTLDILAKVCEQTGRAAEAQELSARAKSIRDKSTQAAPASS